MLKKCIFFFSLSIYSLFAGVESDFFRACLNGEREQMVALYEKEGSKLFYVRDKDNNTPLHLACCSKKVGHKQEIINFLISHKADVNAQNRYQSTPLIVAISNENYEAIEILLQSQELNPNLQDSLKYSALQHAVINRSPHLVQHLLSHPKTNPNFGTEDGSTPLHFAAMYGYIEEAQLLIEDPRTNLNAAQHDSTYGGATPLHFAAMQAQHEIIKKMLERGGVNIHASIEPGLYAGFKPLHFAVMNPDTVRVFETVKLLLEAGANPTQKCDIGKAPKDLTEVTLIKKLLRNPKTELSLH